MNMLIIGNGFDLAHSRPTTYEDFLKFAECIMSTQNYQINRKSFQTELKKMNLNAKVEQYVLNAFDSRKIPKDYQDVFSIFDFEEVNKNCQVSNNKETIQEIYNCLMKNSWYQYFMWILRKNRARGKNWVDFESEIREIISFFDHEIKDIYEKFPQISNSDYPDKISNFFQWVMNFGYNEPKKENGKCIETWSDFIEKTYHDLQGLVRCLEIYLDDCVAEMEISKYSPDIQKLKIDFILSFNYTKIPKVGYRLSGNTHYIHGCAEVGRLAEENNMVLGINEYWEGPDKNTHTNFNLYKKFVQRIIKETGIEYKFALENMLVADENDNKGKAIDMKIPHNNNVYIFGHSLDETDGDVLKEVLLTRGVITIIFYKDKQQQANQIANLSKVLGQDVLLKCIFSTSPSIIFQQQAEMAEMPKRVLE